MVRGAIVRYVEETKRIRISNFNKKKKNKIKFQFSLKILQCYKLK